MRNGQYVTDPKKVYALELERLQRCFSRAQEMGENMSEIDSIRWRHVEHLRQVNFLMEQALMVGDAITKIPN